MKNKNISINGYNSLLNDIKSILKSGLHKAYQAVDNIRVQTYWQIGERIVREELQHKERADYGKYIIDKLAKDLNISRSNLFNIVQFYKTYPIVHTLRGQLAWSHYRILITLKDEKARKFYEDLTITNQLSSRKLQEAVKTNEYEKYKRGELVIRTKQAITLSPEDVFKNEYTFSFPELSPNHSEKELEDTMLLHIQQVLLELGRGFAFVDRQQKILIDGNWDKIDLVFYHIFLKCYILVELKKGKFRSEYIGQINKYINYYRQKVDLEGDNPTIGLIICGELGKEEVYYALGGLENKIFIAKYKNLLPDESEIKNRLRER